MRNATFTERDSLQRCHGGGCASAIRIDGAADAERPERQLERAGWAVTPTGLFCPLCLRARENQGRLRL